jgi:hypothetical protein
MNEIKYNDAEEDKKKIKSTHQTNKNKNYIIH